MTAWTHRIKPSKLETRLDQWIVKQLTRPAPSPVASQMLVVILILVVGLADFFVSPSLSLLVFYLAPILLALIWIGFGAALLASVASVITRVGGDFVVDADYTQGPSIIWNSLGFFTTYLVLILILQSFIKLRGQMEERVAARTAALAEATLAREQLQQELIEVSERERRTIGNDLHDGLGQHLTAMAFAARVLSQQLGDREEPAVKTARELERLADEGIHQSRQLARGLLLTTIDPDRLNVELDELAATINRQSGIQCAFDSEGDPLVSDTVTASNLFRIAEEATRNAVRHSGATSLQIKLEQDDQALTLTVQDNGRGISKPTGNRIGVGLRVMSHRAKLAGGELIVDSSEGVGTRILCRVPLDMDTSPSP